MAAHALVRRSRWAAALAAGLSGVVAPSVALACPYCAGRAGPGPATLAVIFCFVMLPFLVSWVVYRVVRAGIRAEEGT